MSERIKFYYSIVDERAGIRNLTLLSVSARYGVISRDSFAEGPSRAEDLSNYKVCRPNDIVLNRMSAYQGAVGRSSRLGIVSPDYMVIRPSSNVEGRYMHHLFRSQWFIGQMTSRLRGIGSSDNGGVRTPRINPEDLGNIQVEFPHVDEQRRIADFLDAETARIDSLSQTYEITKSTLSERMQCVTDAFIDTAGQPVPLKYFVRFREGPGIMAIDFRDEGTPLIRIAGLKNGKVTLSGANYLDTSMASTRWPQFRLRMGDYVISGSATMGAVSVVEAPEIVGAIPYTGLIILRPAVPGVAMDYVAAALRSSQFMRQIDLLKAGAAMQHFGPTHLSQVSLPFPALDRQSAIASSIRETREHISKLTTAIDKQLSLLAERRQALITAAVTGEIDVTTAGRAAEMSGG